MFEGVHDPLSNVSAYLERIGMQTAPAPTLDALDKLIYAHLTHVPYENLTYSVEKQCPDLTTEALFDKIVVRKRGGYCFELNGLFYSLLQALGYDVYPVACRMWLGLGQLPVGHRASIVTIEGEKYFADVGASGMAGLHAVPYHGKNAEGVFIRPEGHELGVYREKDGEEALLISYIDSYFDPVDFVPLNYYCAIGPAAQDRPDPIVSMTTADGACSLEGNVLKIHSAGSVRETILKDDAAFREALKRVFGIVLDGDDGFR